MSSNWYPASSEYIEYNIAPLLAGAGLIGVAVSLASQNLIKDAINGFSLFQRPICFGAGCYCCGKREA